MLGSTHFVARWIIGGAVLLGGVGVFLPGLALAGPALEIKAEEYGYYRAWVDGREDPRLAKDDEATRLKKIAKQENLKITEFRALIERVSKVAQSIVPENEAAIRQSLNQTVIGKRIREVEINVDSSHVVAFVKWECGDKRDIDKEASYVAWAVGQGGGVIGTLGLWCVNENDTKLFSAQIGRGGFTRIKKKTVERFATTRYARLFEKVKRGPHR